MLCKFCSLHAFCDLLWHFRRTLAANLRQQVAAMMEVEAAEKPRMPTYGSSVRFVILSNCKASNQRFLSFSEDGCKTCSAATTHILKFSYWQKYCQG
jgi:hypothetical protein